MYFSDIVLNNFFNVSTKPTKISICIHIRTDTLIPVVSSEMHFNFKISEIFRSSMGDEFPKADMADLEV